MKRPHFLSACLLLSLAFLPMGCSNDEDETYPSIITEFADMKSNEKGTMVSFTTDDGQTY